MWLKEYLAGLSGGRTILWCYAIWYVVNVAAHFDPLPAVWLTSIGLSGVIGFALLISTRSSSKGRTELDGWQIFRLFLMPFCVSSFSAQVKGEGYFLIFPPSARLNWIGVGCIGLFLIVTASVKMLSRGNTKTPAGLEGGARQ